MTAVAESRGSRESGAFVVSLDVEIAWGRVGLPTYPAFVDLYRQTHPLFDRLLALFDAHDVPATWATVGGLIDPDDDAPDLSRPNRESGDTGTRARETADARREISLFRAPDLVERIRAARAGHDLGSHSYYHTLFEEGCCTPEQAADDLARARAVHGRLAAPITSFVFPQNRVGHRAALETAGVAVYRGATPRRWAPGNRIARPFTGIAEAASTPVTVRPQRVGGLVELPGSMLFRIPYLGVRRHAPPSLLVRRARAGLERAAETGTVFHLFFHPHDFAYRPEAHLGALDAVLRHADRLRDQGRLDVRTMADYADAA